LQSRSTTVELNIGCALVTGGPHATATINGAESEVAEGDTIQLLTQTRGEYRIVGHFK
jgi:hypothetical protein